jgi:nucleoside phosphorylase
MVQEREVVVAATVAETHATKVPVVVHIVLGHCGSLGHHGEVSGGVSLAIACCCAQMQRECDGPMLIDQVASREA